MGNSHCVRLACVSAVALLSGLGAADQANAGGFAVREQSSYFQGSGFAGTAAGGDISSMFWNSAAITTVPGFNAEASGTIIFPTSDVAATGGILALADPYRTTNIGVDTFVPAMYGTYQINDRLYAGIAVNSPFGFATKPDNSLWAGAPIALTSLVRTLDFNPTLAYKITPELSIGVGAQAEYIRVRLNSLSQSLDADSWGAGATAGILWQPSPATSIGLGYRSAITQDLSGLVTQPPVGFEAKGSVTLPNEVTLSARQALTDRLTLLGTVEWQNQSSVGNIPITSSFIGCPGGVCETLNFNYHDQWYFALGAEYAYSPSLTVRTGVNYEISPVDNGNRTVVLPDSNRLGVSVGGSYRYSDRVTFDLAYTHLFFDSAPFCMAEGGGTVHCVSPLQQLTLLEGSADTSVDMFSFAAKYSTGAPVAALEPYKK
ncbi:MAG: outer membrane protein transport protein [Rhodomicrobium sp.]